MADNDKRLLRLCDKIHILYENTFRNRMMSEVQFPILHYSVPTCPCPPPQIHEDKYDGLLPLLMMMMMVVAMKNTSVYQQIRKNDTKRERVQKLSEIACELGCL